MYLKLSPMKFAFASAITGTLAYASYALIAMKFLHTLRLPKIVVHFLYKLRQVDLAETHVTNMGFVKGLVFIFLALWISHFFFACFYNYLLGPDETSTI